MSDNYLGKDSRTGEDGIFLQPTGSHDTDPFIIPVELVSKGTKEELKRLREALDKISRFYVNANGLMGGGAVDIARAALNKKR